MFIDESGDSNLNHAGNIFILATTIIAEDDFQIIEGYLRLLKRKYLGDDMVNIHMTDLCERPYQNYRRLLKPKNKINSFFSELSSILRTVPYKIGIYTIDKDRLRGELGYKAGKKKKVDGINLDLPYEMCSLKAFEDFGNFLISNKGFGEITVESRFLKDGNFLYYFDKSRQYNLPGGKVNESAKVVHQRINSVTICNKKVVSGGLEIADITAYSNLRRISGDPMKHLKVNKNQILLINSILREHSYLFNSGGKIKIMNLN